jgi:hypothetical protein
MAYGFEAKNDSGKVIINDVIQNLHFVGKASLITNDIAAGGDSYNDFPGYSGSNDALDGRVVFKYKLTSAGTPVVFIKPNDYNRWHGQVNQYWTANTSSATRAQAQSQNFEDMDDELSVDWWFEIMVSGESQSNPPDIYCFINAHHMDFIASNDTHGLIVYKSDGTTKTFDSRRQPLAITGGGTASAPPSDPTNSSGLPGTSSGHSWNYSSNDHDFRSSNRYTQHSNSAANTSNAMFSCPSIAQGVYKRQQHGYKQSCGYGVGCQDHNSTAAWWVMYRQAFRLRSGYFDSGWTNYAAGYSFSSVAEDGGWFGGGGGSWASGSMPYTAKTINLQSNAYIIADSSRYD